MLVHIQRLWPDDWERLRRIRMAALSDSPDAFGSTLEAAMARGEADWRRQLEAFVTFVAVIDERDIGMVRGAPHDTDPASAFLLSLWVAPDFRGRGCGEQLVQTVVAWARSAGYSRLLLDVADGNASAVALYARMGFEPTGATGTLPAPRTHVREHRRALPL